MVDISIQTQSDPSCVAASDSRMKRMTSQHMQLKDDNDNDNDNILFDQIYTTDLQ